MKSRLLLPTFAVIVTAAVSFGMNALAQSFTEPSSATIPPNNNVDAPLDVGASAQSKTAGLVLNTGGASNGLLVPYGNVGIGTLTPATTLNVIGKVGALAYCDENGNNCITPGPSSSGLPPTGVLHWDNNWTGNNFWCDAGYTLRSYHYNGNSSNNATWFACVRADLSSS